MVGPPFRGPPGFGLLELVVLPLIGLGSEFGFWFAGRELLAEFAAELL